jgi:hypothetical protein
MEYIISNEIRYLGQIPASQAQLKARQRALRSGAAIVPGSTIVPGSAPQKAVIAAASIGCNKRDDSRENDADLTASGPYRIAFDKKNNWEKRE